MNCRWVPPLRRGSAATSLFLLSFFPFPASAQPAAVAGDLIIAGTCLTPDLHRCAGFVDVRDSGGARKFSLEIPMFTLNILTNGQAIFLAGSGPPGSYTPEFMEIFPLPIDYPDYSTDLAADALGNLYVLSRDGSLHRIRVDDMSSVDRLPSLPMPEGYIVESGDLGTDQCTLYYSVLRPGFPRIVKRQDVCRNAAVPDVPLVFPACNDVFERTTVRVARDGSVIIAACSTVYRFTDTATRVYILPPDHVSGALALDPDGSSFWSISNGGLVEVDFATGTATIRGPGPRHAFFGGMDFLGSSRSAVLAPAAIPAMTPPGLLLFAVAVAVIALLRIARGHVACTTHVSPRH